ncbi:MAG: hypothetical protein JW821_08690, partial [Deltaproteobacteria bacterium]|nr:hypothetical protein [Deltaproteobacteria bacterium]
MTRKTKDNLKKIQPLTAPVSSLKGIGPKRGRFLARKGISSVVDLLFFTPLRYEDRTRICPAGELREGVPVLVRGRVLAGREERFPGSGKRLFRIRLQDGDARLDLIWFHYRKPHLEGYAVKDRELLVYGTLGLNRGVYQMIHPEVTAPDRPVEECLGFTPVYSPIEGLSPGALRGTIEQALDLYLPSLVDPLPGDILRDLGLPDLAGAVREVHRPPAESSLADLNAHRTPAHRRLLFDRFFL